MRKMRIYPKQIDAKQHRQTPLLGNTSQSKSSKYSKSNLKAEHAHSSCFLIFRKPWATSTNKNHIQSWRETNQSLPRLLSCRLSQ